MTPLLYSFQQQEKATQEQDEYSSSWLHPYWDNNLVYACMYVCINLGMLLSAHTLSFPLTLFIITDLTTTIIQ